MALPPTIPTSFVPRSQTQRPERLDFMGAFFFVGVGILAIAIIGAGAVFGYKLYLERTKAADDALVAHDEQMIDPTVVAGFVRLQQRINTTGLLLNSHIILSQLFSLFEQSTPANVRLGSFAFVTTSGESTGYTLSVTGTARSFNSLAVASASFSAAPYLRNVIFSNLTVAQSGDVTFTMNADIDPKLVSLSTSGSSPSPSATTTP